MTSVEAREGAGGEGAVMRIMELFERWLARTAWRLRDRAARECGEAEADAMVGPIIREYMEKYPDERSE